jgi:hypothetical protein
MLAFTTVSAASRVATGQAMLAAEVTMAKAKPTANPKSLDFGVAANGGRLRLALLSPGTTASKDVFAAFCWLGVPTHHWVDGVCSTYKPQIDADRQCGYQGYSELSESDDSYGYFPIASKATELVGRGAACARWEQNDGKNVSQILSENSGCRIRRYLYDFRTVMEEFHEGNTSAADDPFFSPSIYTTLMPDESTDQWVFVYSHRNATEWAASRMSHGWYVPVCDVRHPKLTSMASHGKSPLDTFDCLRFCVHKGVATGDDTVGKCFTTIMDLGEELAAEVFKQHTYLAIRNAPGPVFELDTFSNRLDTFDIFRRLHAFVREQGLQPPCKPDVDASPTKLEEDENKHDESKHGSAEKNHDGLSDLMSDEAE